MTGINIRDLRRVPVPVPPRHEQERISRHVGGHQQHADRAINQASRHIALLLEYRTRLISDVVTGKIDVRETAAKLPDDPGAEDAALDDAIEEAVAA